MAEKIVIAEIDINSSNVIKKIVDLNAELEVLKKEQKDIADSTGKTSESYIAYEARIKSVTKELNANKTIAVQMVDANKVQTKATNDLNAILEKEASTIQEAKIQNKELKLIRDGLNTSTVQGAKAVDDINKKIDKNDELIKNNSSSLEKQKINIGNYTDGVKGALGSIGLFGSDSKKAFDTIKGGFDTAKGAFSDIKDKLSSLRSSSKDVVDTSKGLAPAMQAGASGTRVATTAMGLLKGAISATGIGLLLVAFSSLVSYFTKSLEGSKTLKVATAALGAIFDTLTGTLVRAGKLMIDFYTLNWKDLGKDIKEIGNGFKNIVNNAKEASDIAKLEFQLTKDKRKNLIDEATIQRDIAQQRLLAADRAKTNKERIDALRKSLDGEKKLTEEKINIANQELNIIQKRVDLQTKEGKKASKEDKDRIAELTAAKINAESEEFQRSRRATSQLSTLQNELAAQSIAAKKESIDKNFKNQQGFLEASILLEKENSNKRLDLELKLLESKKNQELSNEKLTKGEISAINQKFLVDSANKRQEYAKKEADEAIKIAQSELDLYIKTNKSKIDSDKYFSQESLAIEIARLQDIEKKREDFEQTRLDNGQITEQEYQNNILSIQADFDSQKKDLQKQQDEANKERLAANAQLEFDLKQLQYETEYEQQQAQLDRQYQEDIKTANKTGADKTLIAQKYFKLQENLEKERIKNTLTAYSQLFSGITALVGENTVLGKAAAIADATIQTYLAATNAYAAAAKIDPIFLAPTMAGLAIAAGFANIAKIEAVEPPKAARGMLLNGNSHAQGGIKIEAEGGEAIINKRSTAMFLPQLSAINEAGGGVKFASGGITPSYNTIGSNNIIKSVDTSYIMMQRLIDNINQTKVVAVVDDINIGQYQRTQVLDRASI